MPDIASLSKLVEQLQADNIKLLEENNCLYQDIFQCKREHRLELDRLEVEGDDMRMENHSLTFIIAQLKADKLALQDSLDGVNVDDLRVGDAGPMSSRSLGELQNEVLRLRERNNYLEAYIGSADRAHVKEIETENMQLRAELDELSSEATRLRETCIDIASARLTTYPQDEIFRSLPSDLAEAAAVKSLKGLIQEKDYQISALKALHEDTEELRRVSMGNPHSVGSPRKRQNLGGFRDNTTDTAQSVQRAGAITATTTTSLAGFGAPVTGTGVGEQDRADDHPIIYSRNILRPMEPEGDEEQDWDVLDLPPPSLSYSASPSPNDSPLPSNPVKPSYSQQQPQPAPQPQARVRAQTQDNAPPFSPSQEQLSLDESDSSSSPEHPPRVFDIHRLIDPPLVVDAPDCLLDAESSGDEYGEEEEGERGYEGNTTHHTQAQTQIQAQTQVRGSSQQQSLADTLQHIRDLECRCARQTIEIKELEQRLTEAQRRFDTGSGVGGDTSMDTSLAGAQTLEEISRLRAEAARSSAKEAELARTLRDYQRNVETLNKQLADTAREKAKLEELMVATRRERDALEQQVASLSSSLSQQSQLASVNSHSQNQQATSILTTRIQLLQEENNSLRKELSASDGKALGLEREKRQLDTKTIQLSLDVESLKNTNAMLQQKLQDMSSGMATNGNEVTQCREKLLLLSHELADAKGELVSLRADIKVKKSAHATALGKVADTESLLATERGNVSSLRRQVAEAERVLAAANGKIAELQDDVAKRQKAVMELAQKLETISRERQSLKEALAATQGETQRLTNVRAAERQVLVAMREENGKLQAAVVNGGARVRELEGAVNELSRRCNELTFRGYDL